MDAEKSLQKWTEHEREKEARKNASEAFIKDVKTRLFLSLNMGDFLSAAPMTLSLIGLCYVASTTTTGSQIKLTPPKDGFKHLKWTALNANLVQCSDQGRMAFMKAEVGMGNIASISQHLFETVGNMIKLLGDINSAKELRFQTRVLKTSAERCLKTALEMNSEFEEWLNIVMELHGATVQQQASTGEMLLHNQIQLQVLVDRETSSKQALDTAKETMKDLKGVMQTAEQAFKKASKSIPNGWELIAQQFVSSLADQVASNVGSGIMASFGTPGVANHAVNIFSKASEAKEVTATWAPKPGRDLLPPDANDPAYHQIRLVSVNARALQHMLASGEGSGVNWDDITDPQKSGLIGLMGMMEDISDNTQVSNTGSSQKLRRILETFLEVSHQVAETAEQLKSLGAKPPPNDSEKVQNWQQKAQDIVKEALELETAANNLPGGAAGSTPLVSKTEDPHVPTNGTSVVDSYLRIVSENIEITSKTLETTSEAYQRSSDSFLEVQQKVSAIMSEMAGLKANTISLEEVKQILAKCLTILVELKKQITSLCQFFAAFSSMIEDVVESQVNEFVDYLSSSTDSGPSIAGFSFTDFQRQLIFTYILMTRAYFTLFRKIAQMYTEVSREHIFPGLKMCDELSKQISSGDTEAAVTMKMNSLTEFSNEAQKGIKSKVDETQSNYLADVETLASEMAESQTLLPPIPESQTKAIEKGLDASKAAVAKAFDNTHSMMLLPFQNTTALVPPEES
ncbi:hypothetical protein N7491_004742 [Penicillium cf. griseofulvum]|uniref:Uncharacterized protein n=1 Tax=Penicillium cf. griseofulvum TaxID=2972120 RepID=A0A9W9J248_9EURO|nr:hypothetical protein N7472_007431 [Penicillium cf. griseofulvum]KAJ5434147.1 hypothetical protein N7491_004742 [Penicillium cf. griseofulvum]KAJ5451974.1 hypothetical protein N7445_000157 [Penicillium cf. griseofulvum]